MSIPSEISEEISQLSDSELVKLTLESQDNFVYLVNRYKHKLRGYIGRLTNLDSEDVEDVLQEVFIKVYLNLNGFNDDLKFSSWIYRITHNQVISGHRKLKARPEGYAVNLDDELARGLLAETDISGEIDSLIVKEKISLALEKISSRYREVLVLKFMEEKSYQEISDILKKPLGTVASLMNKAKKEFKQALLKVNFKV